MIKLNTKWKWVAKDQNENWCLFEGKPLKADKAWAASSMAYVYIGSILLEKSFPKCDWQDSLYQVIDGEMVKHIELKVDDKVMVRVSRELPWNARHFSHYEGNTAYFFDNGRTSWTKRNATSWAEWRLPTEEELK